MSTNIELFDYYALENLFEHALSNPNSSPLYNAIAAIALKLANTSSRDLQRLTADALLAAATLDQLTSEEHKTIRLIAISIASSAKSTKHHLARIAYYNARVYHGTSNATRCLSFEQQYEG